MNNEQRETYLGWLADAHAMEVGLIKTLEKQVEDTQEMPDIQTRLVEHLEETRDHAEKIKSCLERHGEDASRGKDWLSRSSAAVQGWVSDMPEDALVKNVMASYGRRACGNRRLHHAHCSGGGAR